MNGEQLCYMHGFVHRSLFIKIQNGDIPKCRYLNSIGCQFRITQLTIRYNYRLTLLVATTRQFSLIILRFRLQTDFFLCSFTFGFGRKIEL